MKSLPAKVLGILCLAAAISAAFLQDGGSRTSEPAKPASFSNGRQAAPAPVTVAERRGHVRRSGTPASQAHSPAELLPRAEMPETGVPPVVHLQERQAPERSASPSGAALASGPNRRSIREFHPDRETTAGETGLADREPGSQVATAPKQDVAVAALLLTQLPPEKFAELGAHEQAAITELGNYADEAVKNLESSPDSTTGETEDQAARIRSETDAYLRATLGFARFNQLSFLASGVSGSVDNAPRPQHF